MKIYYQDLKDEAQAELYLELEERMKRDEPDFEAKAQELGLKPYEYLAERVGELVNTRNWGVEMDF